MRACRWGVGFARCGLVRRDLSLLFCSGSFLMLFQGFVPLLAVPLSRPVKRTYQEHSRKCPGHNQDLSRKKGNLPVYLPWSQGVVGHTLRDTPVFSTQNPCFPFAGWNLEVTEAHFWKLASEEHFRMEILSPSQLGVAREETRNFFTK